MPLCDIHCSENIINTLIKKNQDDLMAPHNPLAYD